MMHFNFTEGHFSHQSDKNDQLLMHDFPNSPCFLQYIAMGLLTFFVLFAVTNSLEVLKKKH